MSENSQEFSEKFPKISYAEDLYPKDEGFSWRKIPSPLWNLKKLIKAKTNDIIVALAMANHTAQTRQYPVFSLKQTELAEVTGLSLRAISSSIRFLALNNVISVHVSMGCTNRYRWNESFLKGAAQGSVGVLNDIQSEYCTTFSRGTERGADIYIEFSLELFITSFKEFFADYQPPYNFYVPGKRRKKGNINEAPQGSGATIQVSRKDAWREAAYHSYSELKKRGVMDALPRLYLALRASNNIEDVNFPKAALLYRVFDAESLNESRSKSHLREFLHSDEDFKDFVHKKNAERRH